MTIPVTILTGFLGAGKTTLLNHALRSPLLSKALVIINELGDMPLDHDLVREVREDVILLESGCVCCTLRTDLVQVLLAESQRGDLRSRFDRVLVETTGAADPTPIVSTLVHAPELNRAFHLDATLTVIDAERGETTWSRHPEAMKQILLADDLILTKTDLIGEEELIRLRERLQTLNPQAQILIADRGVLEWRSLFEWNLSTVSRRLDVPRFSLAPSSPSASALFAQPGVGVHQHGESSIRSFSVWSDAVVDYESFSVWLSLFTQFHGDELLRVKGLLRTNEQEGPLIVQAVQHVVYPTYSMKTWPSLDRRSRLVALTRDMNPVLLEAFQTGLQQMLRGAPAQI